MKQLLVLLPEPDYFRGNTITPYFSEFFFIFYQDGCPDNTGISETQ